MFSSVNGVPFTGKTKGLKLLVFTSDWPVIKRVEACPSSNERAKIIQAEQKVQEV